MGPRNYDTDLDAGPRFAMPRVPGVVKTLMWINAGVWLLSFLVASRPGIGRDVYEALSLAPQAWRAWFPWLPLWQLVTYGFLHSVNDPLHVLFNMLGLYFFGTWLEGIVGARRFLLLYLASIALGGAVQLAGSLAFGETTPTVGASGAVLFLIVAMAVLRPNAPVIFFIFPMKLRTLALIYVGLDVFTLIKDMQGAGSGVAVLVHLTGAAFGFAAAKLGWIWIDPVTAWEARKVRREVEDVRSDAERLDELLAQIHQRGIGSLTRGEREFLKRMSSRK